MVEQKTMDNAQSPRTRLAALPLAQREVVLLLILVAAAALLFWTTRELADWSRRQKSHEAAEWHTRGESLLAAGQTDQGLAALRRAVAGDRANRSYALALARGLEASHRDADAERLLKQLRDESPDDPEINCRLARLAVARQDVATAVRYYHSAMYDADPGDSLFSRQAIAFELASVLLDHGDHDGALAELIALSRDLPPDAAGDQREVARLFLRAGDPARALTHFLAAAVQSPAADALAGAATAEIALHNFPGAVRDGRAALRDGPNPEADAAVRFAELVLETDPLAPGIRAAARARRLSAGLDYAAARHTACAATTESSGPIVAELDRFRRSHPNPRDLDVLRQGIALVTRASEAFASCAPAGKLDGVWSAIAGMHGGTRP
jgi:tetratricopeptide (TPR) repeat protein